MYIEKIVLMDVQGMWGGNNIYLIRDNESIVQIVDQTMYEHRYQIKLTEDEWQQLAALVVNHNFLNIEILDRFGVHGEARPTISIKTSDGNERVISKWANDKHEAFDIIYKFLLQITEQAKQQFQ